MGEQHYGNVSPPVELQRDVALIGSNDENALATERSSYRDGLRQPFATDWAIHVLDVQEASLTRGITAGKTLAYYGIDEVNQDFAAHLAAACGATVVPLWPRDPSPDGQFDAVLYDIDSLPHQHRQEIVGGLLALPRYGMVGVHSYQLEDDQDALCRNGFLVSRRLDLDLVRRLLT
jgi:hypothetical protein